MRQECRSLHKYVLSVNGGNVPNDAYLCPKDFDKSWTHLGRNPHHRRGARLPTYGDLEKSVLADSEYLTHEEGYITGKHQMWTAN
ncbi:hypothetical protein PGT21_004461 [Puccinia graminis f. sp. tritici]|uniref:Uncharacterized protein n=1 Tax=Puccinia graminis f. sp. tritici TaxID=56615 RepID=A0A5B0QYT4_PUCGR|nr:hypothetical protein PGT21_004461 [Puccinia graminis f. sp. tritici]KAA1118458.1 hypothetical protein PGTUg99_008332 [Puccinia graminis f. sp. tritici]